MQDEIRDPTADPFSQAIVCWEEHEGLLKRSGELFCEAEKLRRDSMASLMETSRLLCEAFDNQKQYGDWGRRWKDKEHSPPFSKQKADRLRDLWQNTALRDSSKWKKLPTTHVSKIEDLSTIPADKLRVAIDDDDVYPKITGAQVATLVARLRDGSPAPEVPAIEKVRRALKALRRQLANDAPPAAIAKLVRQAIPEVFPEEAEA